MTVIATQPDVWDVWKSTVPDAWRSAWPPKCSGCGQFLPWKTGTLWIFSPKYQVWMSPDPDKWTQYYCKACKDTVHLDEDDKMVKIDPPSQEEHDLAEHFSEEEFEAYMTGIFGPTEATSARCRRA